MLGLLHRLAHLTSVLAIAATLAILAAAVAPRWRSTVENRMAVTGGAVTVSIFLSVWGVYVYRRPENFVVLGVSIVIGGAIAVMLNRTSEVGGRWVRVVIMVALIGTVMLVAHLSINERPTPGFDTLRMHQSAAEELLKGENPYLTATAPNSYIFAPEGSVFVGYIYPPSALVVFAGSDIAFGDSRWASALAVSAFIALLLAPWSNMPVHIGLSRSALALAFVALPQLGIVIWGAWTDLIALPLLLGAAMVWKRYPIFSAVLLGLAFSTKPYFLPVLPLLLLWPSGQRIKRLATVGSVVVATYIPFLLMDAQSVIQTFRLQDLANAPVRPDSIGLAGLGINVPRFLSAVIALITGVVLARRGGSSERFFLAMAAVLSVAFLTAVQVFINYWFLIAGLLIITLAILDRPLDRPADAEVAGAATAAGGSRT